jgi:hypothetical protein
MLGIDVGQLVEFGVRHTLLKVEEARVDRVLVQLSECVENTLAVLGSDSPHGYRGPVLQGKLQDASPKCAAWQMSASRRINIGSSFISSGHSIDGCPCRRRAKSRDRRWDKLR